MTRFFSILTILFCLNFISVSAQEYMLIDPPPGKGYYELRMSIDSNQITLAHHRDFPQPIHSLRFKVDNQYYKLLVSHNDQNQTTFMVDQDLQNLIAHARKVMVWVMGNNLVCVKNLKKPQQVHPLNIAQKED